jgi:hypothetical protein
MLVALKQYQTGAHSQCEDIICRELLERADHGIKKVNDVLVRLVVRSVAGYIKRLSQKNRLRANNDRGTP